MLTNGKMSFYVYDEKWWDNIVSDKQLLAIPASARTYDNAIVEPLRKIESHFASAVYAGGVCTSDFDFIAGNQRIWKVDRATRKARMCMDSYEVPTEELTHREETVIFGGMLCDHFGHVLCETTNRLWYPIEHPERTEKIVFVLHKPGGTLKPDDYRYDFLELAGIPRDRVEVINRPTQFARVIVPDETSFIEGNGHYKDKFRIPFDHMRDTAMNGCAASCSMPNKIYLTRTQYGTNPLIGEEYFEDVFRALGYQIVSPEKLPLRDQIKLVAGATDIACTAGTIADLIAFARDDANVIILNRSETPVAGTVLMADMRNVKATFVDAHMNFLPESQGNGTFLVGPSRCWESFLADRSDMTAAAAEVPYPMADRAWEYVQAWGQRVHRRDVFAAISGGTTAGLARRVTMYALGNDMPENELAWMQAHEDSALAEARIIAKRMDEKRERLLEEPTWRHAVRNLYRRHIMGSHLERSRLLAWIKSRLRTERG